MKKLILLFFAIAFACSVNAQNAPATPAASPAAAQKAMRPMKDWVMMRQGKMMMTKNGKWMPMDKEVTMSNGTKVMADGTVMMKDGTKSTMKNGDRMDMDGKLIEPRKMMNQKQAMPTGK